MSELVVPLRSKRQKQAQTLQKMNHAIPAIGLFLAGQQAIREGHAGFGFYLGIFELVSSVALIVLFVRELRSAFRTASAPHHAHHGIDWVDIAAGFVLVAEVLEHWHLTHHIQRPTVFTALTAFALGLFHGRLVEKRSRKRVLRVDATGIFVGGRPLKVRRLEAAWDDLSSIDVGPRWAVIRTRAGRSRTLDLPDLEREADARAALQQAQQLFASHARSREQAISADPLPAE